MRPIWPGPVSAVLHGGVVIYLVSHAAIARRAFRQTSRSTLVAAVLIAALTVPGAHAAPPSALRASGRFPSSSAARVFAPTIPSGRRPAAFCSA